MLRRIGSHHREPDGPDFLSMLVRLHTRPFVNQRGRTQNVLQGSHPVPGIRKKMLGLDVGRAQENSAPSLQICSVPCQGDPYRTTVFKPHLPFTGSNTQINRSLEQSTQASNVLHSPKPSVSRPHLCLSLTDLKACTKRRTFRYELEGH